jgi:S-adenosylmethionine synthetase
MDLNVERIARPPLDRQEVEVVERKGLGHPDSICDALAEELSISLSRFYLEHFGWILHHNVDKLLLAGGVARPSFGGGVVLAPIELYFAGRAIRSFDGTDVPVEDLAAQACRRWLRTHLHALDAEQHVVIHTLVGPGSSDLVELFARQRDRGIWLANDTSCGVGYAPLSELERIVLGVEQQLNTRRAKRDHPAIGEDLKLMGVRRGDRIQLTLACAFVDRYVKDIGDYRAKRDAVRELATGIARSFTDRDVAVVVNTADDLEKQSIYFTVTGTSAESGDDGEAGRGNRINGLIAPYRTMTMESVAGKNPITHVGKLYNIVAGLIASDVVEQIPEVDEARCCLVSQIGRPISDPQLVDVKICCADAGAAGDLAGPIREIVDRRVTRTSDVWKEILSGVIAFDRWPLRQEPEAAEPGPSGATT